MLIVLAAVAPPSPPRNYVVHFSAGNATVHAVAGGQHVVIRDANGNVMGDSYCGGPSGTYAQIVRFAVAIKSAAELRNRAALIDLMQYPLRVNWQTENKPHTATMPRKTLLLRRYADVFTPQVLARLRTFEPHDVFCRDGMAMIASGTLWASVDARGSLKGTVVNR